MSSLGRLGNSSTLFLILQTKSIGASVELTILIYAGFNLVAALISYPTGFLSDRWGRRSMLLPAFLIFLVSYLGFARARDISLIATLFVFYGLFQGIFRSVGKAFASDFVPELLRASALGWYSTTIGLLALGLPLWGRDEGRVFNVIVNMESSCPGTILVVLGRKIVLSRRSRPVTRALRSGRSSCTDDDVSAIRIGGKFHCRAALGPDRGSC